MQRYRIQRMGLIWWNEELVIQTVTTNVQEEIENAVSRPRSDFIVSVVRDGQEDTAMFQMASKGFLMRQNKLLEEILRQQKLSNDLMINFFNTTKI
ncbi:hypothetical protein MAR_037560 [Mya arenaria]|uniref:Uncharacterized protein n=1 Tax=Mya arenaria TaxID=6604 RepID=A0ABY7FXK9_MYAAR|nr:hypothetical protein MAR_037560 [Mya arenaria]